MPDFGAVELGLRVTPYGFQVRDAVFVLEALLGAEAVTSAVLEALEAAPAEALCWPSPARPNPNQTAIAVVAALGWVLVRAPRDLAEDAVARLRRVRQRTTVTAGPLARTIDVLLGDARLDVEVEWERRLSLPHLDPTFSAERARHAWSLWVTDPQDLWIADVTPLVARLAGLRLEPRWFGPYLVTRWAPFDHPFVEALAATLAEMPAKFTKKQLDVAVRELFARVVAEIHAVRGDHAREALVCRRAALDLVALRARAGDRLPTAHVVHILGVDGQGRAAPAPIRTLGATAEETDRWLAEALRAVSDSSGTPRGTPEER